MRDAHVNRPAECPHCLEASAADAVRVLAGQPIKEWLLHDEPYTVAVISCPECGQSFVYTCGTIVGAPPDLAHCEIWQPITKRDCQSLHGLNEDQALDFLGHRVMPYPCLKRNHLGARWERDMEDRLAYEGTRIFAIHWSDARYAMGREMTFVADIRRLKADHWMHELLPGSGIGDAVGAISCRELAAYVLPQSAQAQLREPVADMFMVVTGGSRASHPHLPIRLNPSLGGVAAAVVTGLCTHNAWGIAEHRDGYRMTGPIHASFLMGNLLQEKKIRDAQIMDAYLDIIGVISWEEAMAYAAHDRDRATLSALDPKPDFVFIHCAEF
jgi:hypothetical protein